MKTLVDNITKKTFSLLNNKYFLTFLISLLILVIYYYAAPLTQDDNKWYIELAKGNYGNVHKPFSTRILYPFIVGKFSTIFGVSLINSFFVMNVWAMVVFVLTIICILNFSTLYSIIAFPLLFSPLLLFMFSHYILPELFFAALLSLFFVCTITNKYYYALVLLFLLCLTRENAVILSLCIVAISLWKSQKIFALGTIVVTLFGVIVTYLFALQGGPNVHNLNPIIYMMLKIPVNFLSNVMGLRLWTDTLASNPITAGSFSAHPWFSVMVPKWLQLGGIHEIGILPFSIEPPVFMAETLLTIFGVIPSLLFLHIRGHWNEMATYSHSLLIILAYGMLSVIIGTSSGADVFRLISCGWPAFVIAAPILICNHYSFSIKATILLFGYQLIACWAPWIVIKLTYNFVIGNGLIIGCGLIMHYLAINEFKKARNIVQPG
jgi:hypothetical protein